MGKTLEEMLAAVPAARRRKIEARAAELVGLEMTLRDLRKAMGRTQAQLARMTGKPQATISRMEGQSDMLLSNLSQVVEAMGGRVRIVAELPGRMPVTLIGLDALSPAKVDLSPAASSRVMTRSNNALFANAAGSAAGKKRPIPSKPSTSTDKTPPGKRKRAAAHV